MAFFRKIHTKFWSDPYIQSLTPERKYFFLYILTNEFTKQCGIYEITIRQIAYDTGYNKETVEKLMDYFVETGKIMVSKETNEIAIKNWKKYNDSKSPGVQKCVNEELMHIKNTVLIEWVQSGGTVGGLPSQKEKEKEKEKEIPSNDGGSGVLNNLPQIVEVKATETKRKNIATKKEKARNPDAEPYFHSFRRHWIQFNKVHRKITPDMDDKDHHWLKEIAAVLRQRALEQVVEWTEGEAIKRFDKFLSTAYAKGNWLKENFRLSVLYQQRNDIFTQIANPDSTNGSKTHQRTTASKKLGTSDARVEALRNW